MGSGTVIFLSTKRPRSAPSLFQVAWVPPLISRIIAQTMTRFIMIEYEIQSGTTYRNFKSAQARSRATENQGDKKDKTKPKPQQRD